MNIVDEDRALLRQLVYHKAVVDDLFANVNRRAKGLKRNTHNVDRPHYARAETAGLEQKDALFLRVGHKIQRSDWGR